MKTVKSTAKPAKATKITKAKEAKNPAVSPRKKTVTVAAQEAPTAPSIPAREITSDLIAARAYILWEQQGRPHGKDQENWLLAEQQLKLEIQSFTA
jgi:hypothetical protein